MTKSLYANYFLWYSCILWCSHVQFHANGQLDFIQTSSTAFSNNNNNLEPLDLNICSDNNYRSVETVSDLRRSNDWKVLQLGQSGVIWPMANRSIPVNADCYLQLTACASCQIVVSWNTVANSPGDQQQSPGQDRKTNCESVWDFRDRPRCIDLRLVELDADQTSMKPYQRVSLLNPPAEFRSQYTSTSYKLDLNLQFWHGDAERANLLRQLFPLKYTVIDNTKIIRGRQSPVELPSNHSEGFIYSPRFPKTYPEGASVNYTFVNEDPAGFVRLMFTDFRIHYMSILRVIDSDGQEIANSQQTHYGVSLRPPALQSRGNVLTILFAANNYKHDIGFRAVYKFVKEKSWLEQPNGRPCDKVLEDQGGVISIENLNLDAFNYVDCIWVLEKPRYTPVLFDKLYVKVEDFSVSSNGRSIQLDIHAGRTSINRRILTIFGPKSAEQLTRDQPQEGFISEAVRRPGEVPAASTTMEEDESDTGFYLRLKGYLGSSSGIAVSFAQFYRLATAICHDMNEFHCENGRCILNRFQCDGHDHCGDFSDEFKCPTRKIDNGALGRLGPFGPPTIETESSTFSLNGYTTTILLVAGLIGLTLVLLMVTVVVARVYRQKLLRRFTRNAIVGSTNPALDVTDDASGVMPNSNRASTGTMLPMDEQIGSRPGPTMHTVGNRRLLVLPETEIGVLEAPPTYDDALKHPTVPPSSMAYLQNQRLSTSSVAASMDTLSASTSALALRTDHPDSAASTETIGDNSATTNVTDAEESQQRTVSHSIPGIALPKRVRRASYSGSSGSSTCSDEDSGSESNCSSPHDAYPGESGSERERAGNTQGQTVSPRVDNDQQEESQNAPTAPKRRPPVPLPRSSILQLQQQADVAQEQNGGMQLENMQRQQQSRLSDTLV